MEGDDAGEPGPCPPMSPGPQCQYASLGNPPHPSSPQHGATPPLLPARGEDRPQPTPRRGARSCCLEAPGAHAPSSLSKAPPSGEIPPPRPRAHLQMVQVKCWWSSLVPRLICHFWGERENKGQPRTRRVPDRFRVPSSSAKGANLPWASGLEPGLGAGRLVPARPWWWAGVLIRLSTPAEGAALRLNRTASHGLGVAVTRPCGFGDGHKRPALGGSCQ